MSTRIQFKARFNVRLQMILSTEELTDDVCVDLHLTVLLCQLEGLIVAMRQNQEMNG